MNGLKVRLYLHCTQHFLIRIILITFDHGINWCPLLHIKVNISKTASIGCHSKIRVDIFIMLKIVDGPPPPASTEAGLVSSELLANNWHGMEAEVTTESQLPTALHNL